ncbi:MAG TPA: hypothetical protein ENK25_00050 [Bacteroidetes bacterium]|nr:hypothetical protein [Bacteroidota bacterium]
MSANLTFGLTFKEVLLTDSTTIRLFNDTMKGVDRNPGGREKEKRFKKIHMLIDTDQPVDRYNPS